MFDNQVGHHEDNHRPQDGFDRIGAQFGKVGAEILWVALQMAYQRGPHILQTPTADHRIVARDEESREHTHIAYCGPRRSTSQQSIGACRIGLCMATHNEFADHAGNA